jgi:hypothetical protein
MYAHVHEMFNLVVILGRLWRTMHFALYLMITFIWCAVRGYELSAAYDYINQSRRLN